MAYTSVKAGTTGYDIKFPVGDSSSNTGALLTGLLYNSAGLVAVYDRQGNSGDAVSIALATKTKGTWASGGFIASANNPGWYELGIPDAALASGAKHVAVQIYGAANMIPVNLLIELTQTDNQDANAGGMYQVSNASSQADYIAEWFNGASGTLYYDVQTIKDHANTIRILSANKTIADPITHTQKVYNDAGDAVFMSALIYEDPDAQIPYRGQGISRREKFQ